MLIDSTDHVQLCEAVIRETETAGADAFEKHYVKDGNTVAVVACIVGEHAAEFLETFRAFVIEKEMHE